MDGVHLRLFPKKNPGRAFPVKVRLSQEMHACKKSIHLFVDFLKK